MERAVGKPRFSHMRTSSEYLALAAVFEQAANKRSEPLGRRQLQSLAMTDVVLAGSAEVVEETNSMENRKGDPLPAGPYSVANERTEPGEGG